MEHEHDIEHHGFLVREALIAAQDIEDRLCHRESRLSCWHDETLVVLGGTVCCLGDGCDARKTAEHRECHIHLMRRRRIVRRRVEGIEQKDRAGHHIHDGMGARTAREDAEEVCRELAPRIDAGLEVGQLVAGRKSAGNQEIGNLLVAEAVLLLRVVDEIADMVAAVDEVALIRHELAVHHVVAMDIGDRRESYEHAGAIGIAQAPLHVVFLE